MAATALLEQSGFRMRNDDGDEANATWAYPLNTDPPPIQPGERGRVRFAITETAGKNARRSAFQLIQRVNGGPWLIDPEPTPFIGYDSTWIVGAPSTAQRISSGGFTPGYVADAGSTPPELTINANTTTEIEVCVELNMSTYGSVYNDNDVLDLGIAFADNELLNNYTQSPTFTVAALTQFSKLYLGGQKINEFYLGGALVPQIFLGSQEVYRNT